jgi:hypothetical protein
MPREVPVASVTRNAFACPHCEAHASQDWYICYADSLGKDKVPLLRSPDDGPPEEVANEADFAHWNDTVLPFLRQLAKGELLTAPLSDRPRVDLALYNLHLSTCFACGRPALWLRDRLLYPVERMGTLPATDMPDDIRSDYEEARTILNWSPRGAAALLRLAVQKLCIALGEKGKRIDDDIASLVAKGLDPMVQQALDTVRVVGNEAVHPGQMDLRDNPNTAAQLFELINFIVEQMITRPRRLQAMYDSLPEEKRKAIDERNAKSTVNAKAL